MPRSCRDSSGLCCSMQLDAAIRLEVQARQRIPEQAETDARQIAHDATSSAARSRRSTRRSRRTPRGRACRAVGRWHRRTRGIGTRPTPRGPGRARAGFRDSRARCTVPPTGSLYMASNASSCSCKRPLTSRRLSRHADAACELQLAHQRHEMPRPGPPQFVVASSASTPNFAVVRATNVCASRRCVHSTPIPSALPRALPSISPGENENGMSSNVLSLRLCSKLTNPRSARSPVSTNGRLAVALNVSIRLVMSIAANGSSMMSASCSLTRRSSCDATGRQRHVVLEAVVARALAVIEMAAEHVAVADQAAISHAEARMVLADGSGAIVAGTYRELERPALRDADAQQAFAERAAGLELGVDALDQADRFASCVGRAANRSG